MHSITMDSKCRVYVDTSSDIDRPTTVKVYEIQSSAQSLSPPRHIHTLYNAATEEDANLIACLTPPQLIHFPTADGTETLYAAVYPPDPRKHGPGPYPLVCAVYGGPHVQRVNRSWSQSADMRAQRLRNLGFCVVKCDNRGSSRRGLAFESAIAKRLGRLEVLDQVSAVRQLILRGIVDASRVGVYGWSYGGYLAAMCLCRAPDVFHVAVAGAPVTSWDGYDTHYTERYMGLPADNPSGYRESAVFDHVPNMRGNLMIVHGLIDENVHFRHTSRLINKLIAAGKEYDLLIFPEERHSPRRLRDRIYMEQRISEYFLKHLVRNAPATALDLMTASLNGSIANNNNNGNSHGASKNGNSLRPPSHL
jgi:dipeptidyl-peptidase 4